MSGTLSGRRAGKTLEYRHGVEVAVFAGEHVHAYDPQGAWCVTWQPVGFLWTLLPRSGKYPGARPTPWTPSSKD